ncbi:HIT-type Zinc finger family protein isoform 1 [Hibiscus syriacus]|uniref:HIT-type Zinc finger family protein isoform 1 n=1 Tax=Hibiscus syriacus TaxID=106335 RepID=A0A6A3B4Q2_HIBSY|nr:HIT-type Zinc finger family protein isoform 1 [Hibiscus syriacus]
MIGLAICIGSFWLGMVIPDGPPLGATLVEKSETIIMEVILPCSFTYIGFSTDFYAMKEASWSSLSPLFGLVISGYLSKFLSTLLAAKMIIGVPGFSMLVFGNAILMGIHVPLISILYDPSKPCMVDQSRTIQHTAPNDRLKILVCIKDKRHLPSLVNLLKLFYPTVQTPFSIHVFHLVELIGRANPLFIDHQNQELEELVTRFPDWETIHHSLKLYQQGKEDCVDLQFFSVSTESNYVSGCVQARFDKQVMVSPPSELPVTAAIASATAAIALATDAITCWRTHLALLAFLLTRPRNGADTVAAILEMAKEKYYDMWILGRKHKSESVGRIINMDIKSRRAWDSWGL